MLIFLVVVRLVTGFLSKEDLVAALVCSCSAIRAAFQLAREATVVERWDTGATIWRGRLGEAESRVGPEREAGPR